MALYPISRVGGIDSADTPTPAIQNTAKGVSAIGNNALSVGVPSIGRTLDFDFLLPNSHYPNRFTFGGKILQSKVGNIDSLAIGNPNIANTAIGVAAKGIPPNTLLMPVIGKGLDFDFDGVKSGEPYFHFGKTIITKAGGIVGSVGSADVEQTLGICPTGIGSPDISVPILGRFTDFSFDEIDGYEGRFNFGGSDVVSKATLGNTDHFGSAKIGNTALGVSVQSLTNGKMGKPIIAHLKDPKDLGSKTPSGAVLDFNFNQTHSIRNAKNIAFYFNLYNQIVAVGTNPLAIGSHAIKNTSEVLLVHGFDTHQAGKPKLTLNRNIVSPKGFEIYHYFGQPTIINKSQVIKVGNLSTQAFGKHTIKLALQYLTPKGIEGTQFGKAWLSHFLRYVEPKGVHNLTFGRVRISHYAQFIRPVSIEKSQKDFASNHTVGGTQIISPVGTQMTQWLTRIIPENQVIGIEMGINGELGIPTIANHAQYLSLKGFGNNDGSDELVRFGHTNIFNQTQYIRQYFIADSGLTPQVIDPNDPNGISDFGRWTAISNRNKTIATFGVDSSRFGYQQIQNKAVPVLPTSITGEVGTPMIAYRVRTLALDGIEPPHFSYWHIIRNTARVITLQGIDDSEIGKPSIASNKQFIKQIFPFENNDIGTPMIADRVRTIDIEWRYSIAPPTIPLPTIQNHTNYITPQGFDGTDGYKRKFGRAELMERFNIIKTHGRVHDEFGTEVIIKNLTPELRAFGHNSNEFGETAICNQWRKIYSFGNQMSGMGKPTIKDRKQTIRVDGLNANGFGWHRVIRMSAPPYSLQYIELRKFNKEGRETDGFGIGLPRNQVSIPAIRTNVLFAQGFDSQKIGQHEIVSNGIRIDSGIYELSVGKPRVWIKQQFISPKGIDEYINQNKMGKPQLSPYTIYAPSGDMATAQARTNHPSGNPRPINTMAFGRATISNQHRAIYQFDYGGDMQAFGRASIANKSQLISPKGFRGGYFGWHIIPFVLQTVEQFCDKEHKTAFGYHRIGFIGESNNRIGVKGFDSQGVGKHEITHFHRTIYPMPFVAMQMGRSRPNDTPFMWQGLRVGERVLGNYGGFDSSTFGGAWISNKIREVRVDGFDSFVSESDIKSFKGRLTVKRAIDGLPKQRKPAQAIGAVGIEPNTIHTPNIKNKAHYIRPDGNSEQFRKGAW